MRAHSDLSRIFIFQNSDADSPSAQLNPSGARRAPARSGAVGHPDEIAAVLSTFGRDRIGHLALHNRTLTASGADIRRQSAHVLNGAFTLVSLVTLQHDLALDLRRKCLTKLAPFRPAISLIDGAWTLTVTLLDAPGAFHKVADSIASASANICFWTTSSAPAPHFGTPYARIEALAEFPSDDAVARARTALYDVLAEYDGVFDLKKGVCLD